MSCFSAVGIATSGEPDPTKHVNYNLGMVLGVDDFTQEFAYLSGRDQWLTRDLIGYGTVRGLRVAIEVDTAKGPRVVVEPGVALSPRGQLICVPSAQCAYLKDSLAARGKELQDLFGSSFPNVVQMYVVLCYRDCPTDDVPIAGEPCRGEDELKASSRLTDDFMLELRLKAPNQREEDAVRDFVAWLKQVAVTDTGTSTPLDKFLSAIRDSAEPWLRSPPESPPASPPDDFMFLSPPSFLEVRVEDSCEYMSAAFRLWVTELRPKWIARWHGCAPAHFAVDDQTEEDCVMLAELVVPIVPLSPGGLTVDDHPAVVVDERRRPYVVHLRMLQEWLLCGCECVSGKVITLPPPPPSLELKITNTKTTLSLGSEHQIIACDTTDGAIEINLPPTTGNDGRVYIIKHAIAVNTLTVIAAATDVIDRNAKLSLDAVDKFVQIVANQTLGAWHVVGGN